MPGRSVLLAMKNQPYRAPAFQGTADLGADSYPALLSKYLAQEQCSSHVWIVLPMSSIIAHEGVLGTFLVTGTWTQITFRPNVEPQVVLR